MDVGRDVLALFELRRSRSFDSLYSLAMAKVSLRSLGLTQCGALDSLRRLGMPEGCRSLDSLRSLGMPEVWLRSFERNDSALVLTTGDFQMALPRGRDVRTERIGRERIADHGVGACARAAAHHAELARAALPPAK